MFEELEVLGPKPVEGEEKKDKKESKKESKKWWLKCSYKFVFVQKNNF